MFYGKTISGRIAAHVAGVTAAALTPTTLHCARRSLLDAIGVMLGATGLSDDVLPYRRLAETTAGPSRLLGSGTRSSPALAALANGALAHALDFGDTFDPGPAHPHAALVPALLALADMRPDLRYGELLAALVVGGDLACRLSIAPPRPFEDRGWYPPPLVNLVAGAAGCAKLLGLDADGVRHAMGLALFQGAFPGEIKYDAASPIRGVREGFAARGAVEAALLAAHGATAFAAPLEGRAGFFTIYGGGPPGDALTSGLGERFLNDGVSFKPWPSCRGTHPYIEAALRARAGTALDAIERIEAETGPIQAMLIRPQEAKAAPSRPIDAKFSIPFTVATALLHGEVTLASFTPARLRDDGIGIISAKVVERSNPDWGRAQAASGSLTFHLADGTAVTHRVMQAAGHPDRPMSDSALIEKLVDCAARAAIPWPPDRALRTADAILAASLDRPIADILD